MIRTGHRPSGVPLRLVYDGRCGFCTRAATWIGARARGRVVIVPSQQLDDDALDGLGLTRSDVDGAAWSIRPDGTCRRGHLAVADALRAAPGWPRVVGSAILVPPLRWLAVPGYAAVVRWRRLIPGPPGGGPGTGT
ncbi:MAG: DCC1-like thiol-disulfide oxidoreductase family protein [Actinomycetota bacterium]|nr:DCC1-like thiol-disulfide oxidoreductase family protein [Actinomycetota bacterium]